MNGLQLALWVGAVALVLWHWRHECARAKRATDSAGDVTSRVRDSDDHSA